MPSHRQSLFTIRPEAVDRPEILMLLEKRDAYQASLYPAECCHFTDLRKLAADESQAIRLYQRHGYRLCSPFFPYGDDPLSVYMEKTLEGGS
ncbi:hypothetical protein WCU84_15245 [Dickeya chrysanthemi]|uniref:GCN5-related N-acetyltransferase n=1 Tax=Dickeya chrysanthemi TaxID=556 RepID=A0ABU8JPK0_DICCH